MGSTPLISLAMIVKNEADRIAECLQRASAWVDEIVVLDTGSTDDTCMIVDSLGVRLERTIWYDDFAQARNQCIHFTRGKWILTLDADEQLMGDPDQFIALCAKGDNFQTNQQLLAFALPIRNVDQNGIIRSEMHAIRLFPRHTALQYISAYHEQLQLTDHSMTLSVELVDTPTILHTGYDPEEYKARGKSDRALRILKAQMLKQPHDLSLQFYVGRELLILGDFEQSIRSLENTLATMIHQEHPARIETIRTLIRALQGTETGEPDRVLVYAELGLFYAPNYPDFEYARGIALLELGRAYEARKSILLAIKYAQNYQHQILNLEHPSLTKGLSDAYLMVYHLTKTLENQHAAQPYLALAQSTAHIK